jgi:hypothetical protein
MRRAFIIAVITAGIVAPRGYGQSAADAEFRSASWEGIHLYGVSIFGGYSTSAYPGGFALAPVPGAAQLGSDVNYGSTASIGWQYHRTRSDFSVLYSGTYSGAARYSAANAFNQSMTLSASRILTPKWTLALTGAGSDLTVAEFVYQPTNLSLLSQTPASADDLAAAFSVGQFSSSQIASSLTGSPVLESPARSLLMGDRILSYSGQLSLNYAYSSRLAFHIGSFAAAGQRRLSGNTSPGENYVLPHSVGLEAGMGVTYMLSPRTDVGLNVSGTDIHNRFQKGIVSNAVGTIGRKMGIHWFLSAHGGAAFSNLTSQLYAAPRSRNMIGGGSIGFRTFRHTLIGSYERSATDGYGTAIGTTSTLTGAWDWHRPGSRWNVSASFSQQGIRNTGYLSLSGWEASGGVTQTLSSHMRMTAQYVYLSNSGDYLGSITNLAVHSVRLSMSWVPEMPPH